MYIVLFSSYILPTWLLATFQSIWSGSGTSMLEALTLNSSILRHSSVGNSHGKNLNYCACMKTSFRLTLCL